MIDLELREKVARLMHKPVDDASMFYIDGDGVHRMRAQGWGNRPTPAYETDIAAAWEVVEFMREKGFEFDCCQELNGVCWARFTHADGRTSAKYVSKPMPLAICRASVAAMENNHES